MTLLAASGRSSDVELVGPSSAGHSDPALVETSEPKMKMKKMHIGSDSCQSRLYERMCCYGNALCRHLSSKCDVLLAGQVLSFLLACSGAAQATLALDCKLQAPMFTMSLYYAALAVLLLIKHDEAPNSHVHEPDRIEQSSPTSRRFWQKSKTYFPIALLDVYSSYLTILAFNFTTLTSVTLLDALAIPSALILSKVFLDRHFTKLHFLGVFLCLGGILVNILQDYEVDEHEPDSLLVQEYPRMMLGDFLAICGGLLVGCSNVVQEISVRKLGGPYEYLGYLGLWATVISGMHCFFFERDGIIDFFSAGGGEDGTCSRKEAFWILGGYFVANVSLYIGTSQFLQYSEATFYNLSLLTGDVWSVVFSILAQGIRPHPLFFVALICTVSGVMVYEMAPSPVLEDRHPMEHGSHVELGQIDLGAAYDDHSDGSVSSMQDDHHSDLTLTAVVC